MQRGEHRDTSGPSNVRCVLSVLLLRQRLPLACWSLMHCQYLLLPGGELALQATQWESLRTSFNPAGGLLCGVLADEADALVNRLHAAGYSCAAVIGDVLDLSTDTPNLHVT